MNTERPAQTFFNLRLTVDQHEALRRVSRERDVTVSNLIREAIGTITGVPDEIDKFRRYRNKRT